MKITAISTFFAAAVLVTASYASTQTFQSVNAVSSLQKDGIHRAIQSEKSVVANSSHSDDSKSKYQRTASFCFFCGSNSK